LESLGADISLPGHFEPPAVRGLLLAESKRHEEMTDRLAAAESKRRRKAMHRRTRAFCRRKDW
jgi:hypothetical protein